MGKLIGLQTTGRSYVEIEGIARDIRRQLCPGLALTAALPGIGLFESLDEFQFQGLDFDFEVADIDSEGRTYYDRKRNQIVVTLSVSTYDALERQLVRARYTLTHELGHGVLHAALLKRLGLMPHTEAVALHRLDRTHEAFRDTEWQANAFASAILMPAAGIAQLEQRHGALTAQLLVDTFLVSHESASFRLQCFRQRRDQLL